MPGRKTHMYTGAAVAAAAELLTPTHLQGADRIWHFVGAVVGGAGGGVLPDVLEPACDPNHRQFCHGLLPALAAWYWGKRLYMQAYRATLRWAEDADPGFWLPEFHEGGRGLPRWVRMLIAGFVRGVIAGYISHLALDLCTPRSLPLVGSLDRLLESEPRPRRRRPFRRTHRYRASHGLPAAAKTAAESPIAAVPI